MSAVPQPYNYTRISGVSTEQLITPPPNLAMFGALKHPCVFGGIIPEATTVGTIIVKDTPSVGSGEAVLEHTFAIGLAQTGVLVPGGIKMTQGLSVTPSSASDSFLVLWYPSV